MSIASALTALQTDITNARTAITTKGGTVTSGGGSSQLATDIASIPSGGTLQTKTATVTANGTVTYSADSGYDGLSSVEVTTNVQGVSIATFEQSNFPVSGTFGIAYGNGKFVAVKRESIAFAYSIDGENWTTGNLPTATSGQHIAFGNGMFVVPASGRKFCYSSDGINWSTSSAVADIGYEGAVCYGGNKFVYFGSFSSSYLPCYSSDGINWSVGSYVSLSSGNSGTVSSIAYCNGVFVAKASDSVYYFYSTDGENWTESTLSGSYQSVVSGRGMFAMVSTNTYDASARILYSYDGTTWTDSAYRLWNAQYLDGLAFALGVFIKYRAGSTTAYFSTDAINWTQFSLPLVPASFYDTFAEGEGKIVYINSSGKSLMCDRRPQFA